MVIKSADKVKPEPKAPSTMAVGLLENKKDLKLTNDMLGSNARFSELTVMADLLICEGFTTPAFERGAALGVNFGNALITAVSH